LKIGKKRTSEVGTSAGLKLPTKKGISKNAKAKGCVSGIQAHFDFGHGGQGWYTLAGQTIDAAVRQTTEAAEQSSRLSSTFRQGRRSIHWYGRPPEQQSGGLKIERDRGVAMRNSTALNQ
jgi:hypothetical protein